MTFGSLFAGIGGFDLGFERAGLKCRWQVEIDPYCWQVLHDRWPTVPKWDDVRTFPPDFTAYWNVDVICGGFPCQDISNAGKREGIDGERSGLWRQFERIIRAIRPQYVVVENTAALLARGMGRVLGDLAAIGFDAEWHCLPAASIGAPHLRDRVFIVAYSNGKRLAKAPYFTRSLFEGYAEECRRRIWGRASEWESRRSDGGRVRLLPIGFDGRGDDGLPHRMDRIRCLGNAVVPQVAEFIGRRLIEANA